jgi:integrase
MTYLKLAHVHRFRDRHGKVRHYFRRNGKRTPLPGVPGSAAFMAAYHAALAGEPAPIGADRAAPGTMAALAADWFASAEFRALSPAGQRNYRRIVDRFLAAHGHRLVADMESRNVRKLLDERAATPSAANRLLSILRLMMRHAVERGWREDDPTREVRRLRHKVAGHPTWTEEDIAAFEAHWPLGTRARLSMALLLFTGQRRSDAIRLGWQHVRGGAIDVIQGKTGARLAIPIHQQLRAALDAMPAGHLTFLVTEAGAPFASGNAFYNWFIACARAAGVTKSPHGLRKAAARRLAEAGCTPHQIAAITGHRTLAEVERYTRAANQEEMAKVAIGRIGPKPNGS